MSIDYIQELESLERKLVNTIPPLCDHTHMEKLDDLSQINNRITELEAERRLSLAHANLVFEHSRVGQIMVSLDNKFIRVNKRYAEIVKRTKDELVGMTWQEITHPADLAEDEANAMRLKNDPDSLKYWMRKRYLTPCGEIVWVVLDAMIMRDEDGNPLFFHVIVEDMTMIAALYNQHVRPRSEVGEHGS